MNRLEFHLSVIFLLILQSNSMYHKRFFKIVPWPWLRTMRDIAPLTNSLFSEENNRYDSNHVDDDPEVRPGLFEGDIAIPELMESQSNWRVSWKKDKYPHKLWANGIVPYVISPLYAIDDYITIYTAIRTINYMTCVRFVPWDGKHKDFLVIAPIKRPKGCWSFVGRQGGPQPIGLEPPDGFSQNCLNGEGKPIHELMHALGFHHEQSRADRDTYVTVHYENIKPGMAGNFEKKSLEDTNYTLEYDYGSVMHYGRDYFSKDGKSPTLTAKFPEGRKMGQRKGMSTMDCLKVNQLYDCLDKSANLRRKYYHLCMLLGV